MLNAYLHSAGGPCLTALVAGEAAERFEEQGSAESVAKVMAALRTIFAPKRIHVPPPVQVSLNSALIWYAAEQLCLSRSSHTLHVTCCNANHFFSPSAVLIVGMC